jgi:hypothetical protein
MPTPARTKQPEAMLAIDPGYALILIPASIASMVLPHLRIGDKNYVSETSSYQWNFKTNKPEIALLDEEEVAAMQARAVIRAAKENQSSEG